MEKFKNISDEFDQIRGQLLVRQKRVADEFEHAVDIVHITGRDRSQDMGAQNTFVPEFGCHGFGFGQDEFIEKRV